MKIGVLGCGAIGSIIMQYYKEKILGQIKIIAVYDSNLDKCLTVVKNLKEPPQIMNNIDELIKHPEISLIVEAASQKAVKDYAIKILENNKDLMIMSVGALADKEFYDKLLAVAKQNNRKIFLPSGAIAGIDAIKSAQLSKIFSAEIITRKPPSRFKNIVLPNGKTVDQNITEPEIIFKGNAKEAQELFPRSINVAATLSLVSLGPEKTKVTIIADPTIDQNMHEIIVKGEFGKIQTIVENTPSIKNPRTSYLAALSAVRTLKKIVENIQIGT
ncbi:MAG: aspartate dehydrogenase [Candidatus Odinarchaeia archaeon]